MGLTIRHGFGTDAASPQGAKRLVEAVRQRAPDLPFAAAGDLPEFRDEACRVESRDDPAVRRLLTGGRATVFPEVGHPDYVFPTHVIGFLIDPGPGCETAPVGLARCPAQAERVDDGRSPEHPAGRAWRSFCKRRDASNPDCGGGESFLRRHPSVAGPLDHAVRLGRSVDVTDERGFRKDRNVGELAAEASRWNRGIAAFTGELKDLFGGDFAAEITRFRNFERLEADGRRGRDEET